MERKRVRLDGVTLCAADCQTPRLASRSLALSQQQCDFADAILFTDAAIDGPFRAVAIEPIRSLDAYQDFTTRRLVEHIRTPHVLVTQWDGYVLDATRWDPAFLDYDYIGAVWPGRPEGRNVGNSGFSLQSRRLLEALMHFQRPPGELDDNFISVLARPELERRFGIRFAPADVAWHFSYESPSRPFPTFGFHGLGVIGEFTEDDELVRIAYELPPQLRAKPAYAYLMLYLFGRGRLEPFRLLWRAAVDEVGEEPVWVSVRQSFRDKEKAAVYFERMRAEIARVP